MTAEHTGVRLTLERKQEAKNKNGGGKKNGRNKKGKYLLPPSHVALDAKSNMRKHSVEGRMVVVLLKGLHL